MIKLVSRCVLHHRSTLLEAILKIDALLQYFIPILNETEKEFKATIEQEQTPSNQLKALLGTLRYVKKILLGCKYSASQYFKVDVLASGITTVVLSFIKKMTDYNFAGKLLANLDNTTLQRVRSKPDLLNFITLRRTFIVGSFLENSIREPFRFKLDNSIRDSIGQKLFRWKETLNENMDKTYLLCKLCGESIALSHFDKHSKICFESYEIREKLQMIDKEIFEIATNINKEVKRQKFYILCRFGKINKRIKGSRGLKSIHTPISHEHVTQTMPAISLGWIIHNEMRNHGVFVQESISYPNTLSQLQYLGFKYTAKTLPNKSSFCQKHVANVPTKRLDLFRPTSILDCESEILESSQEDDNFTPSASDSSNTKQNGLASSSVKKFDGDHSSSLLANNSPSYSRGNSLFDPSKEYSRQELFPRVAQFPIFKPELSPACKLAYQQYLQSDVFPRQGFSQYLSLDTVSSGTVPTPAQQRAHLACPVNSPVPEQMRRSMSYTELFAKTSQFNKMRKQLRRKQQALTLIVRVAAFRIEQHRLKEKLKKWVLSLTNLAQGEFNMGIARVIDLTNTKITLLRRFSEQFAQGDFSSSLRSKFFQKMKSFEGNNHRQDRFDEDLDMIANARNRIRELRDKIATQACKIVNATLPLIELHSKIANPEKFANQPTPTKSDMDKEMVGFLMTQFSKLSKLPKSDVGSLKLKPVQSMSSGNPPVRTSLANLPTGNPGSDSPGSKSIVVAREPIQRSTSIAISSVTSLTKSPIQNISSRQALAGNSGGGSSGIHLLANNISHMAGIFESLRTSHDGDEHPNTRQFLGHVGEQELGNLDRELQMFFSDDEELENPCKGATVDRDRLDDIASYNFVKVIGKGGYGVVWLVQRILTGDHYAMKLAFVDDKVVSHLSVQS